MISVDVVTEDDWQAFEALKLSFKCDHCAAIPGVPCMQPGGLPTRYGTHASRNDQAWALMRLTAQPPDETQKRRAEQLVKEWRWTP